MHKLLNEKYGINISPQTILAYVRDGRTGELLKKRGPNLGFVSKDTFDLLLEAYQTYIELAQINGSGELTKNKNLLHIVNTVAAPTRVRPMGRRLLEQSQNRSPHLKATLQNGIEERMPRKKRIGSLELTLSSC